MDIKSYIGDINEKIPQDILKHNITGAVGATTTIYCNTKCWHGLLSVYDSKTKEQKVLLSNIDDTVIVGDTPYCLAVRKYPNVHFPLGHRYITDMSFNPYTKIRYQLGEVKVLFEMMLTTNEETIIAKYTVEEAALPVKLQIRPLVAFRSAMQLMRMDRSFCTDSVTVENGIAYRPNDREQYLYMQFSKPCSFSRTPDWNYNIEYAQDFKEGKPYQEDLFMPGIFEVIMELGEKVYFTASTKQQKTDTISEFFGSECETRAVRKDYNDYICFSAEQMFREVDGECQVLEKIPSRDYFSYHLFGALPGLTLPSGNYDQFLKVMQSYIGKMKGMCFGSCAKNTYDYQSPLWMIWAVQQFYCQAESFTAEKLSELFGATINQIVKAGINNELPGLSTDSKTGLVSMSKFGETRFYADINALWYNALLFVAEIDSMVNNMRVANKLREYAVMVKTSFLEKFKDPSIPYLADSVSVDDPQKKDLVCRPGQLIAYALPYAVAPEEDIAAIIKVTEEKLLTNLGLRTCPEDSENFGQNGEGDIYPIYLGFLAELYLRLSNSKESKEKVEELYNLFNVPERIELEAPNFYEKFDGRTLAGKGSPMFAGTVGTINRIRLLSDSF